MSDLSLRLRRRRGRPLAFTPSSTPLAHRALVLWSGNHRLALVLGILPKA